MRKPFLLISLITIILFSCKKERETVTPDMGYDYAGLEVGKYVVYDVDSFYYDDFTGTIDTSYYQIKELVDSKYIDLENEEAYKIIRYRKEIDSTNWVLTDVWNGKITGTNFQKVEENIRYVKMIFPTRIDKTWNGNAMNNNGDMQYEYTAVDATETIGSIPLNSVLTVLQKDETNLVEEKFFEEKYARGIGMVYKKSTDITNVYNTSTGLWERSSGIDITMTLSSYGG